MTSSRLSVVILCISMYGIVSATNTETDSLFHRFELAEVEVTARTSNNSIIPCQTLSGQRLQTLNALNIADALRYFSGVQIKDYGGIGGVKTINIRSMGSEHVGVYYNGIQLGNAQNGQIDLGRFSLDNMESIELYNGQKSDIFQSAREFGNAGSIYLYSRKPIFKDNEPVHIRAKMKAGSFDLANPSFGIDINLLHAQKAHNDHNLYLTIDGEYIYSSGKYKFRYKRMTSAGETAYDTTAIRHNGDINAMRIETSLHHYYSPTGFWRIHIYNYYSERGIPGAIVNNVWRNGERLWDRNNFIQIQWQDMFNIPNRNHSINRILKLKGNMKYANDWTRYNNNDQKLLPVDNKYLQQEIYTSIVGQIDLFEWWKLSVSYDFQWNQLNKREKVLGEKIDNFVRYSHWLNAATEFKIKQYAQIQASYLMTHIENSTHFTPAVFINIHPFRKSASPYLNQLQLNTYYKHSFRYPTFNDLYYTDMGNANLKPELARQRNVGIAYSIPFKIPYKSEYIYNSKFNISIDYYNNHISDKIIAYPKGQQFRWTMINLGNVIINGIDTKADMHICLPAQVVIHTTLTYTYQKAIDKTNPTDSYYGHQIPYIPWHSGCCIAGIDYVSKHSGTFGLNYSFIYVGERYSQQENIIYNYVQPWYTHDITVYGEWEIINKHKATINNNNIIPKIRAQIELNNMLGQDYEVIANYPMPKQNIRCTINFQY